MGWWSRLRRLFRAASLHRSRGTGEQERLLQQLLDDIDAHLADARVEVALCQEEERRLSALAADEEHRAVRMRSTVEQALRTRQSLLARAAAAQHLNALRQAERFRTLWKQQRQGTAQLQRLLEELELKRADLAHRRHLLFSRRHLAEIRRSLLKQIYGNHARGRFEDVEEEVYAEELTADAYQQLMTDQVAADIAALDSPADPVDTFLAQVHAELQSKARNKLP